MAEMENRYGEANLTGTESDRDCVYLCACERITKL